jgi:D-alanyl-D-alanine carboxypeptidase (penicillin-binding protein 5/6)
VVTISPRAGAIEEASLDLVPNEKLTVQQLLLGMLLKSANDAAFALAEHLGGNQDAFAAMMNTKAAELGLTDTHFVNPHGLHDPRHYTTALDLAELARTCTVRRDFREIVCLSQAAIPGPNGKGVRVVPNRNRLIGKYPGADGVKTGFTRQAGRCLICSATRGRMQLLAVTMGCQDTYADARSILDWGFARFEKPVLIAQNKTVAIVPVRNGTRPTLRAVATSTVCSVLPKGAPPPTPRVIELNPEAPVAVGQIVGELSVPLSNGQEARVPLAAAEPVARSFAAILRDKSPALSAACCLGLLIAVGSWAYGSAAKGPRRRRRGVSAGV